MLVTLASVFVLGWALVFGGIFGWFSPDIYLSRVSNQLNDVMKDIQEKLDEVLTAWTDWCLEQARTGRSVWCYFNNDIHGHAIEDARTLKSMSGSGSRSSTLSICETRRRKSRSLQISTASSRIRDSSPSRPTGTTGTAR